MVCETRLLDYGREDDGNSVISLSSWSQKEMLRPVWLCERFCHESNTVALKRAIYRIPWAKPAVSIWAPESQQTIADLA